MEERVLEGNAALARGAWAEARAIFEQELEVHESVDALEGLSWAAWWVEDVPTCIEARERAFRLSRRQGDRRRAAMLALWVGDDYLILRGERAIANGWFQRAARILDGLDYCPRARLARRVARIRGHHRRRYGNGSGARDPGAGAGAKARVVSLEMFAVGVEGLALVNEGAVADGMGRLDEATAAALAGEFEEIVAAGWTFCFLLNACERVRDFERAAEWCRKVAEFSRRMHTNFVTLSCRAHYGAVLTWQGRWPEAEKSLTEAERLASRATLVGRPRDRAARGPAPPAGTVRRGGGAPPAGAGQRTRTLWSWPSSLSTAAMPRPQSTCSSRPSAGPGGEQDPAPRRSR